MAQSNHWVAFEYFSYRGVDPVQENLRHGEYLNPIIAGFYPDPSICRVGDDFYLVNSTFAYFPGVPIFHSRDLIHWEQIGHVLDRSSQLDSMDGLAVSAGIYAPTLRYHQGRFYMITTLVGGRGNFVVHADNPRGPWSDPIDLPEIHGIDPSLFFDNGHVYVVNNGDPPNNSPQYDGHRAIWLQEIDLSTGKVIGAQRIIVDGGTNIADKPIWIEGPHLFKQNDWYYLTAAEGGTGDWHSQVMFRSREIWGPYLPWENNPILTQRDLPGERLHPITCTGHADLVELANGKWWAVFLGCRPYEHNWYNTGRETFLLPVTWEDGWPRILPANTPVPLTPERPALSPSRASLPTTGTFDWSDHFASPVLNPRWLFLRTPTERWFEAGNRTLRLQPRDVQLNERHNPSFLAHRQQHAEFSAEVTLRIEPHTADADAGLVAFQNETHHLFAGVRIRAGRAVAIFIEQMNSPEADWQSAQPQVLAEQPLAQSIQNLGLRISASGRTHQVHYSTEPGGEWSPLKTDIDGSFLSTAIAGGFQGVTIGMFARTTRQ